jgi:hypothetical protein
MNLNKGFKFHFEEIIRLAKKICIFKQRPVPKDRELSFNLGGGHTDYRKGQQEVENYKQVLAFCTKVLWWFSRNAIENSSFSSAKGIIIVILIINQGWHLLGRWGGSQLSEAKGPPTSWPGGWWRTACIGRSSPSTMQEKGVAAVRPTKTLWACRQHVENPKRNKASPPL